MLVPEGLEQLAQRQVLLAKQERGAHPPNCKQPSNPTRTVRTPNIGMAAGTHAFPTFPACVSATPPHPTPKICHKVRLGDTIRVMATILRLRRRAIHAKHTAPPGAFFIPPRRSSRRVRNKSLKKALNSPKNTPPVSVLHSRNPSFTQETGKVQNFLRPTAPTLDAFPHRAVGAVFFLRDEQHPRHVPLPQRDQRRAWL